MSNHTRKSKRVPSIPETRLDTTAANHTKKYTKSDVQAYAFIEDRESIHSMTLRLPINIYKKIKEDAYKSDQKISHLIIDAIKNYLSVKSNGKSKK